MKKYETPSLDLDACSQDEGAVISQISDIPNRDGHATDEEKLASTSCGQKSAAAEVKGIEKETCQKMEKEELAVHVSPQVWRVGVAWVSFRVWEPMVI